MRRFEQHYSTGKTLGSGAFGCVKLGQFKYKEDCTRFQSPSPLVAIKILILSTANPAALTSMEDAKREIQIMSYIHKKNGTHENIVDMYECFQEPCRFVLVLELCSGQDLFDNIMDSAKYNELEAAASIKIMASTLSALQSWGVVHRDLKPENFVYSDKSSHRRLKLLDFGLAYVASEHSEAEGRRNVGTDGYKAPEIWQHELASSASDVWSLGCILFILLSGTMPFNPDEPKHVLRDKVLNQKYYMTGAEWTHISAEAKELICRMLVVDRSKRITIAEILSSTWVKQCEEDKNINVSFGNEYFERLRKCKAGIMMRGAVKACLLSNKLMKKVKTKRATAAAEANAAPATVFTSITPSAPPMTSEYAPMGSLLSLQQYFQRVCHSRRVTHSAKIKSAAEALANVNLMDIQEINDVDGGVMVKYDEFIAGMTSQNCEVLSLLATPHFFEVFSVVEEEESPIVDYRKILLSLATLNRTPGEFTVTDDWVLFCFRIFDANGDGCITLEEFYALGDAFFVIVNDASTKSSNPSSPSAGANGCGLSEAVQTMSVSNMSIVPPPPPTVLQGSASTTSEVPAAPSTPGCTNVKRDYISDSDSEAEDDSKLARKHSSKTLEARAQSRKQKQDLLLLFQFADLNSDGQISLKEFTSFLTRLYGPPVSLAISLDSTESM